LAGVIGGVVFVVFFVALGVAWFWAVLAGLAGYVGTLLLGRGPASRAKDRASLGASDETVTRALEEGRTKIRDIVRYGSSLPKEEIRAKVKALAATAEKIFTNIERDPKDLHRARQFLNYYLDAATNIVKRYAELVAQQSRSAEVQETLEKAESVLGLIDNAFENQLSRLLQDDVMNLDTEIELLQKTVETENLFNDTLGPAREK
jgi:5-bromo-4-chloroindolyl phosphate hydrolysis protein